jgi:hypothetical protein
MKKGIDLGMKKGIDLALSQWELRLQREINSPFKILNGEKY